jgi:hypothetical protein
MSTFLPSYKRFRVPVVHSFEKYSPTANFASTLLFVGIAIVSGLIVTVLFSAVVSTRTDYQQILARDQANQVLGVTEGPSQESVLTKLLNFFNWAR